MFPFGDHPRANGLRAARDHPVLLLARPRRQQQVQLLQVLHAWHGHQIVPPELAPFALHASFLVSLAWRTELRCESPVRAETDEPRGLFPLMASQDFLHGTFEVVVTQNTEYTAKIGERQLMRFQPTNLGNPAGSERAGRCRTDFAKPSAAFSSIQRRALGGPNARGSNSRRLGRVQPQ